METPRVIVSGVANPNNVTEPDIKLQCDRMRRSCCRPKKSATDRWTPSFEFPDA